MPKPNRSSLVLLAIAVASLGVVLAAYFAPHSGHGEALSPKTTPAAQASKNPFDGEGAYKMLQDICALGPRPSGSAGMVKQQELLIAHFRALGAQVHTQDFDLRDPQTGAKVTMKNIIVEWHPEKKERVLLCAHYDTRPFPDQDLRRPKGKFIGANDGASGPALLSELGRHMSDLKIPYGVDFVLFDGEELVYDAARDKYFLGSEYFAKSYVGDPPAHRYQAGVLLDMVADKNLDLHFEGNSLTFNAPLAREIWKVAQRLKIKEFVPRVKHTVSDDHLPLNNIARIPTIDIIDFDYPRHGAPSYWHTEADTPDKCSASSLGKVGWVLLEWLQGLE